MRDWGFPDVITMPTDAGPNDDRIVFDSIDGRIEIWKGADLVGLVTSAGPGAANDPGVFVFTPGNDSIYTALENIVGVPGISFSTDDVDMAVVGRINAIISGTGVTRNFITDIFTPRFTGRNAATLRLTSPSADGTERSNLEFGAGTTTDPIKVVPFNVSELPRFESSADGAVLSADTITDMVLTDLHHVAGHFYRFYLHSELTFADLSTTGRWLLVLRDAASTVIDRFESVMLSVAGTTHITINAWVEWEAPTTGTTSFHVFADETAGGATIQLRGAAAAKRYLSVEHKGAL